MDPEKLNDDQKRTMMTLPALETIQKELGEVKKVIEACLTISLPPPKLIILSGIRVRPSS
jgi:hypothetical protein